ncbi:FAD-binding protein, partial [bacterium]|nr:FAD-binding protein [bacterium]
MKYDVIIIGAGLGGLTAGAKLVKEGKKVLVLEQHSQPGGCATTFQRGDFTLEVGLHEMDGPAPRDMKTRIFNDLDVFSHVEFLPVPEFYRFMNGRFEVTVPHDPALASERLSKLFPDETAGIKVYFEQILTRKKPAENDAGDISVGQFLDSIIKNDDLKLILLGNLGYFHDDPYTLSLAYYSIAQGSYYSGGASYIKGGSQKLADHLAGFIREHG